MTYKERKIYVEGIIFFPSFFHFLYEESSLSNADHRNGNAGKVTYVFIHFRPPRTYVIEQFTDNRTSMV